MVYWQKIMQGSEASSKIGDNGKEKYGEITELTKKVTACKKLAQFINSFLRYNLF